MKEIPLTRGYVALVDDEDYEWLSQWKWSTTQGGRGRSYVYATRKERIDGKRMEVSMHRLIMNTPKGMETDHINGNGLDNRRCNLRTCTTSQNQMNKKSDNSSGYKGVSWIKARRKWKTQIQINKKGMYLGYYSSPEEAARAYDKAAQELFGEFAALNFPEG